MLGSKRLNGDGRTGVCCLLKAAPFSAFMLPLYAILSLPRHSRRLLPLVRLLASLTAVIYFSAGLSNDAPVRSGKTGRMMSGAGGEGGVDDRLEAAFKKRSSISCQQHRASAWRDGGMAWTGWRGLAASAPRMKRRQTWLALAPLCAALCARMRMRVAQNIGMLEHRVRALHAPARRLPRALTAPRCHYCRGGGEMK